MLPLASFCFAAWLSGQAWVTGFACLPWAPLIGMPRARQAQGAGGGSAALADLLQQQIELAKGVGESCQIAILPLVEDATLLSLP